MRLIDLHCNWGLQYAGETNQYDPGLYPEVASRVGQVEGYLTGVSAAVLCCGRRPVDWAQQADPWHALGEMIARYEAEFAGRLLCGPADLERWQAEPPDGLCWGVLALEGIDAVVRSHDDLERLPWLADRGIRVIGLAVAPGDGRGLSDVSRSAIDRLDRLTGSSHPLALDLAGLNGRATRDVLDWYEADPSRATRLLPLRSHGAIAAENGPAGVGLDPDDLRRFRRLGGTLGLSVGRPFAASAATLREQIEAVAAVPHGDRPGHAGIGIGTDFLGFDEVVPELENAPRVVNWLGREFPPDVAAGLIDGAARAFLTRLLVHRLG